jgi:hypothetical protein
MVSVRLLDNVQSDMMRLALSNSSSGHSSNSVIINMVADLLSSSGTGMAAQSDAYDSSTDAIGKAFRFEVVHQRSIRTLDLVER